MNNKDSEILYIKLIEYYIDKIEQYFDIEKINHTKTNIILTEESVDPKIEKYFGNMIIYTWDEVKKIFSCDNEPEGLTILFPKPEPGQDVNKLHVKFSSSIKNLDGTLYLKYKVIKDSIYIEDDGIGVWIGGDDEE
ncbi:MAG: hypothetical protein IPL63_19275 [Saprospiraceae bacterium]|nr:hypothetical protein [Saprospiraceae bacterium]